MPAFAPGAHGPVQPRGSGVTQAPASSSPPSIPRAVPLPPTLPSAVAADDPKGGELPGPLALALTLPLALFSELHQGNTSTPPWCYMRAKQSFQAFPCIPPPPQDTSCNWILLFIGMRPHTICECHREQPATLCDFPLPHLLTHELSCCSIDCTALLKISV